MTGLRRTALTRKSELKRGQALARKKPMARVGQARRTVEKQRRARDTGPKPLTKRLLWVRSGGACELCGRDIHPGLEFSRHHRRARGTGGSSLSWINDISNLLLLCGSATSPDGCHHLVETQRQLAYANGWAISLHGDTPAVDIPVLLAIAPDPLYLTDDGGYASEPTRRRR